MRCMQQQYENKILQNISKIKFLGGGGIYRPRLPLNYTPEVYVIWLFCFLPRDKHSTWRSELHERNNIMTFVYGQKRTQS